LSSHKLTETQITQLTESGFEPVYLPENLQKEFTNVPPEFDPNEVYNTATSILNFLSEEDIDYGLVGGELSLV